MDIIKRLDHNTKGEEIEEIIHEVIKSLEEGEVDALELASYCKKGMSLMDGILKKAFSHIINEKEKHEGKELKKFNCKFYLGSTGERLNYEDDESYVEISKSLKDRQALLKTAQKSSDTIYDQDGIEVPKVKIKSPSKQTINISIL